jgi:hypothetical protein
MVGLSAAVHESPVGPSRHIAPPCDVGRFWAEADINGRTALGGSVAIDPSRTWASQPTRVAMPKQTAERLEQPTA